MIIDQNGESFANDPYLSPNSFKNARYSSVTPYEQGFPIAEPHAENGKVPGEGAFPLAHFQTFNSIVNYVSRTYRWRFDEALRDSLQNSLAMRRDPVVMHALRMRQIPTAQLSWHHRS